MFSKEWFFYVFGRWILISGFAGAMVQYFFADLLRIHTIPAFLLNQFCLACVFWYVDKLIFRRHFQENLSSFFHFPRVQVAYGVKEQFAMMSREFDDLKERISEHEDDPESWLDEFVDLVHAVEMMERILREKKFDVDGEYERVRIKNMEKGYYGAPAAKKEAGRVSGPRKTFLDTLRKEVLLADGAMGTYLATKGLSPGACPEALNLTDPDLVKEVHREYIDAGARIIETNTFAANRFKLARFGLEDRVEEINREGARIAREASEGRAFVAGSVGNLGVLIAPYGNLSVVEAHQAFREQVRALVESGVDLIMIETMTSLAEAKEALLVCKEFPHIPVVCQLSFTDDGRTVYGDELVKAFGELTDLGADVVGLNCFLGPQVMLNLLRSIPATFPGFISIQPNAGLPRMKDGISQYTATPEYMGRYASRYRDLGVSIIGGCCGTTPAHIRAMAQVVSGPPVKRPDTVAGERVVIDSGAHSTEEDTVDCRSWFKERNFVTLEVTPPRDLNVEPAMEEIRRFRAAGADAVDVTENPMARMHMSSIIFCALVKREMDIKTIVHFTTRDRNLLGTQSDLLGAAAIGVDGILAVKGDPAVMGDLPFATSVYDISTAGLIRMIRNLNRGIDLSSRTLERPSRFAICVGVNPLTEDLDAEVKKLEEKILAGAHFAMTQPVYDLKVLERFMAAVAHLDFPILVGILPLKSRKNAEYLHNEVPGITIPAEVREAMGGLSGVEGVRKGFTIAQDFVRACRGLTAGFYLMPPHGYTGETEDLIRFIKSGAR